MTSLLAVGKEDSDRTMGADAVGNDLKQFRKLQHLSDHDIAFRMATTLKEVRHLRNMFGQRRILLREIPLDYNVRLILGAHQIKTLGQLQSQPDEAIRAIRGLGPQRIKHLRDTIKEYLAK